MSAFVCSDFHISFLGAYAARNRLLYGLAISSDAMADKAAARLLFEENAKSVSYRYDEPPEGGFEFSDRARVVRLSPIAVIKAAQCLDYQIGEHPEYRYSDAKTILDRIKDHAISELPGYADAEWGLI
jgi:hypothetical protein